MQPTRLSLAGHQFWPTMFFTAHWPLHDEEKANIIDFLLQLQRKQPERIESQIGVKAKSSYGLYESHFDLFKANNRHLQKLVQFIGSSVALAASMANGQTRQAHELTVDFVNSWYHITNEGGFHDTHVHHGCSWCGIYYLQLEREQGASTTGAPNGGSRFYSPINSGGGYRDYGNEYLTSSIDPPIAPGMLLIFPSFLWHSGLPFRGDTDRIVLAFNARVFVRDQILHQT